MTERCGDDTSREGLTSRELRITETGYNNDRQGCG